jgi:hypothetical protein
MVDYAESKLALEKYLQVYKIRHDIWCEEFEKIKAASANVDRRLHRRT